MKRRTAPGWPRLYSMVRVAVLLWFIYCVVALVQFLPIRYQNLMNLDYDSGGGSIFGLWAAEKLTAVVRELGLRPELLAAITLIASFICLLCFWGIGGLLWYRSRTWMGLLTAYILFGTGLGFCQLIPLEPPAGSWQTFLYDLGGALIWPTFYLTLYLFPNGRFVPRFSRYFAPLPYVLFLGSSAFSENQLATIIGGAALGAFLIGGPVSQVFRYRKVSTPEERQQTKWVVAALVAFALVIIITPVLARLVPGLTIGRPARFWYDYLDGVIGYFAAAMIPLAIGISIFRYRLWDIDVIIRKTLVYSLLTALLALVYLGIVILLQSIFEAISGEQSPISIVISTLVIAALFAPLRRRVQDFIDRRFYRRRYDAEKTLAAFGQFVRDETDMAALTAELLRVTQETMQPEQATIWLKEVKQ